MRGGGAYDAVLVLHVLSAVIGFGALAVTGGYAATARRSLPEVPDSIRRYFSPGTNLPARLLYAVPLLGGALVGMSGGDIGFDQAWLAASLGLWVVAAAVAQAVVWPGERAVQARLASGEDAGESLDRALRRVSLGAGAVDLAAAAAFALMVAQPGGRP